MSEYRRRRGSGGGMLPLLALHAISEYYRLPWKPPVTAALLSANTLIHLRPAFLRHLLPPIDHVWFNPHLILKYKDPKRFFLSAFYHVSDSHLVYNMMSLLWKGIQLETAMGSVEFASMIAALVALSQGITLLLAKSLLVFFDYDKPYYYEYAVGFSGVLFAMKVVLNSRSDDYSYVHGVVVPTKYAAWAELILIQMFVPGVSFLGHLGGILAGIVYLKLKGSMNPGSDPLTLIFKGVAGVLSWPLRLVRGWFGNGRGQGQGRISGRGTVGRNQGARNLSRVWRCEACTFDNSVWLDVCEMCGTRRDDDVGFPYASDELTLDEIRRRRIEMFGR